jgi:uncharacterized membrane protein (DUF485 family)
MSTPRAPSTAAERYYVEYARARKRLVVPLTALVIVFFFVLPILTNFTAALDGIAFSGLTWAYLYAFAQFVMVILVATYYSRKTDAFEETHKPPVEVHPADEYDVVE